MVNDEYPDAATATTKCPLSSAERALLLFRNMMKKQTPYPGRENVTAQQWSPSWGIVPDFESVALLSPFSPPKKTMSGFLTFFFENATFQNFKMSGIVVKIRFLFAFVRNDPPVPLQILS